MSWNVWIIYAAVTLALTASPGPSALLALNHGNRHGTRRAYATIAGGLTGFAMMLALSLAGVGALLAASAGAFRVLRLIGAVYLIYLGIRTWRTAGSTSRGNPPDGRESYGAWERFRSGFAVAASNPKVLVFFGAYLPQFLSLHGNRTAQMLILGATFLVLEASWEALYATAGDRMGLWLDSAVLRRRLYTVPCICVDLRRLAARRWVLASVDAEPATTLNALAASAGDLMLDSRAGYSSATGWWWRPLHGPSVGCYGRGGVGLSRRPTELA